MRRPSGDTWACRLAHHAQEKLRLDREAANAGAKKPRRETCLRTCIEFLDGLLVCAHSTVLDNRIPVRTTCNGEASRKQGSDCTSEGSLDVAA